MKMLNKRGMKTKNTQLSCFIPMKVEIKQGLSCKSRKQRFLRRHKKYEGSLQQFVQGICSVSCLGSLFFHRRQVFIIKFLKTSSK